MSEGKYQNDLQDIEQLDITRYENVFKLYELGDKKHLWYNIVKNIGIPTNLQESVYREIVLNETTPLTVVSFQQYNTTNLWWLICLMNGIQNPYDTSYRNKKIKVLRKEYVKPVLDYIKQQLQ